MKHIIFINFMGQLYQKEFNMKDLEKVIKGLNICTGIKSCIECPYYTEDNSLLCDQLLMSDALKLLKSMLN